MLYVPGIKENLLSISKLVHDNNLTKQEQEGAANRSGLEGVLSPKYDKGDYCWKKEIWVKFFWVFICSS